MTTLAQRDGMQYLPWFIAGLGLLVMYLPTFWSLSQGVWSRQEQLQGPVVLVVSLWLIARAWPTLLQLPPSRRYTVVAWPVLLFALALYVIGRSQSFALLEAGSLAWMLGGCALLWFGVPGLRLILFPLLFMCFMVPLPVALIDWITQPMKIAVSDVVEHLLGSAGYPIAREGVVLYVGQYQLLVADACAGLHTLFTLEAMGLLYLNLAGRAAMTRNLVLALLILPIGFTANVIRVLILTLVTYHLGDAAGQGFLHGFAGMVLFVSALLMIIAADTLLGRCLPKRRMPAGQGA